MKRLIVILFTTAAMASASMIVAVTFDGSSGVNNGVDYVLPYSLTIDGSPLSADCYDFFDAINIGETWQANEDTLDEAAATGIFSSQPGALGKYELVGVMSSMSTPTPQSQIDLQEVMWNVFDPGEFTVTSGMAADLATATGEVPGFDFSNIRYLEPVIPSGNGADISVARAQAFVFEDSPKKLEFTPETDSGLLLAVGLIGIGAWGKRRA